MIKSKYIMRTGAVIAIIIALSMVFDNLTYIINGGYISMSSINLVNIIALILFVLPIFLYGIWEKLYYKGKKRTIVATLFWINFVVVCGIMYGAASFSTWEGLDIDTAPAKPGIERRIKTTILMSLFPVSIALSGLYVASEVIDKRRKK